MGLNEKIWTVPFIILTFSNFVTSLTMWLLSVEMVEYAYVTYGVAESLAGATLTCFVFAASLARIFLGAKTDEWGAKRTLFAVFLVSSVCPFAYLACSNIWLLLVVRCVHGAAFGLSSAAASSAVVMVLPESKKGEGIGYFTTAQALATAIGPFTAITAMNVFGSFALVFVALGTLCLITFFLLFALKLPAEASGRPSQRNTEKSLSLGGLVQISLLPLVGVVSLVFFGYSSLTAFMTLYSSQLGLSSYANLFFVSYAVALMISRPKVGKHVDAHGPRTMMHLSLLVLFVGFAIMSAEAGICSWFGERIAAAALLIAAAMTGFGIGNVQSIVQMIVAFVTPKENLGKANSTFFLGLDIGSGVGPVAIGLAVPLLGYSGIYLAVAFISVAALMLYRHYSAQFEL